jgi:protein-disulfide isomerase
MPQKKTTRKPASKTKKTNSTKSSKPVIKKTPKKTVTPKKSPAKKTVTSKKSATKKPAALKEKKSATKKVEAVKPQLPLQKPRKTSIGLIVSLLIAAVLISASLVYLGFQMGGGFWKKDLQAEIKQGIENYIYEQEMLYQEQYNAQGPLTVAGDFSGGRPFLGNSDAPVTIIMFSDYSCSFCRRFHVETFPQLKEKYIDSGLVKFVYRNYILSPEGISYPSSLLANCVRDQGGDDAFFYTHDALYELDFNLAEVKDRVVSSLRLDEERLQSCFEAGEFLPYIDEDIEVAKTIGITRTPTFIINGNVLVGAQPFELFEEFIDEVL